MRTKTLLLTAALGAAGIATSMAQVYSVNAVGYVNVAITNKSAVNYTFAIVANPLNGTNNNINTVVPTVPDGTLAFFFRGTPAGFDTTETFLGVGVGWLPGTTTVNPGEAFFVALPSGVPGSVTTLTFVGEVPQGNLTNSLPAGFSLAASIVPQAGGVTSVLGLSNPNLGDLVFLFDRATQNYLDAATYLGPEVGWLPSEPSLGVAEGFWYFNTGASSLNWGRTFNVN